MLFIGLDLAWSEKNDSAISVIHGDGKEGILIKTFLSLRKNEQIYDIISDFENKDILLAVDAPLIVKNKTGTRKVDRLITKKFGKYDASAYPVNRRILLSYGGGKIRGEEIVKFANRNGIVHNPILNKPMQKNIKRIFEVYPHPATIILFGLKKTLKYKARKKRKTEFRLKELIKFRSLILSLKKSTPALLMEKRFLHNPISLRDEHLMDSILCAYIAYYYWYWGFEKCEILSGKNWKDGYIINPIL